MAKGYKTGGRKAGTKNRKTVLREKALAAAAIGPIEFMLGVMRANEADPRLRLDAAKGAAQFLHPKPGASKPGIDAKLIGGTVTTSDAPDITNLEWLAQLRAERAAEVTAGRPTGFTDQTITEVERRIAAGIGDKPTSYVPGAVVLSPEEESRLQVLRDHKIAEWADDTRRAIEEHRQKQALERKREVEPQALLPKRKSEWGNMT